MSSWSPRGPGRIRRGCGRLLWDVTEGDPALRDAVSAVLSVIEAYEWKTDEGHGKDVNKIRDEFIAGFTGQLLIQGSNRFEATRDEDEAE